jgi:cell division protein ZipA
MDIKDWILVGGGLLLVAVIGHGFWLAWRSRRDTLRMDIDPNIPRDDVDPLDLLRAELPNGGARVRKIEPHEQVPFELEPLTADAPTTKKKPAHGRTPIVATRKSAPHKETKAKAIVPERPRGRDAARDAAHDTTRAAPQSTASRASAAEPVEVTLDDGPTVKSLPTEVIVINVLARNGAKFGGSALMEAFLRNGLKFGDMNIFHRILPSSKEVQFSVASAVEPGTFDLSAMETFHTPGVSFFMRMPGPDQPLEVFEDMLAVTRDVAASLGADLKDEQLSVMTSQTIQHCRARIEDFSRKRMSQRA